MLNFVSKECDTQNGNFCKNGGKVTPLVVKVEIPEDWANYRWKWFSGCWWRRLNIKNDEKVYIMAHFGLRNDGL